VQYAGVRYLEAMICLLIGTMAVSFFVNWGTTQTDVGLLVTGWVVPMLPWYALPQAVGTVGAVIMPHNLYLHSGLVLSRKVQRDKPNRVYAAIWYARIESAMALLMSVFINVAIIAANAAPFFNQECAELDGGPYACLDNSSIAAVANDDCDLTPTRCMQSSTGIVGVCDEIGLQVEGKAMESALGKSALYIWAIGLLAAGQSSTMVCTYAGQIIMGGCLQIELAPWKRVAMTRVFALGPALAVALSTVSNQKLFNNINEYLNILQSVQLPFAMLPVLHFASSRRHLGRFASGPVLFTVTIALAVVVLSINVVLVYQFLQEPPVQTSCHDELLPDNTTKAVVDAVEMPGWGWALAGLYALFYFGVCLRIMKEEALGLLDFLLCRPRRALPNEVAHSTDPLAVTPAPAGGGAPIV